MIRAFWHRSINFGDQMTPELIKLITGQEVEYSEYEDEETFMVTGSMLAHPKVQSSIIWGCGYASKEEPFYAPKDVRMVRGIESEKILRSNGYTFSHIAYGDPALLTSKLFVIENKTSVHELGIVPHWVDYEDCLNHYQSYPHVKVIDVRNPPLEVIQEINTCSMIASSSLHGLVIAHSYGIPAMQVIYSNRVLGDGTKFKDHASSVNIDYKFINCLDMMNASPINLINRISVSERPFIDFEGMLKACPLPIINQ